MLSTRAVRRTCERPLTTLAIAALGALALASGLADATDPARAGAARADVSSTPAPSPVGDALEALTGPNPAAALDLLPADFADRLGYRPVLQHGRPVNPSGGCSSPVPLPERFTAVCRVHDLGYDLLRYADATGSAVPSGSRAALDAALIEAMHATCTNPVCHAAADVSRTALAANTWRQRGAPPRPESGGQVAQSVVVRLGDALAGRS